MYVELGSFELIKGETCWHEDEKLIICVKANQPIFGTNLILLNTNM